MLGNSRSSLASCSRNFYCIILLASSHTTCDFSLTKFLSLSLLLCYAWILFFIFFSSSGKYKSELKIWKMYHTCLFDFKCYSFVGNSWVDSRITTHYTIFPFLVLCASSVASISKNFPKLEHYHLLL